MSAGPRSPLFTSAAWVLGWRWTDRLFGLVSTIILARLLLPSDFGVIVLASIVIGFIDTVFDLSVHIPLIQKKNASHDDFNTAWTLRLLQSGFACVLIFALAGPAADYFDEPRVAPVMQVLSVTLLFVGLENIGVVYFQREMHFNQDYWFLFIRRVTGFAVAIVLAWYLRSYWALVAGTVTGRAAGLVASYALHPYRPRLSLASIRSLWGVSQWALVRNVAAYGESRADKIAIGRLSGAQTAGAYAAAEEFALAPVTEFLAPLGRALLPVFSSADTTGDGLRQAYLSALQLQCLFALPAAIGIHCIAPELVLVLLGEKWEAAIPFVSILALVGVVVALTHGATYVFMATGRMALLAGLSVFQLTVLVLMFFLAWQVASPTMIAWLRLVAAAAVIAPCFYLLFLAMPQLRWIHVGAAVTRPAVGAIMMYIGLMLVSNLLAIGSPLTLLLKVLAGVALYGVTVLALWFAAGRPQGAESATLNALRRITKPQP